MYKRLGLIACLVGFTVVAQDVTAPVQLVGGRIAVAVQLNGVGPYPFVLDLNAPGAVVDTDVAAYLQLVADASGGFRLESVAVGGAVARNVVVGAADLKGFERILGVPMAGILTGREFGPRMDLDVDAGSVSFSAVDSGLAATDAGVAPFEVGETGGPVVRVLLDGSHVHPFLIDAALAATMSAPEGMLRELGLLDDTTPRVVLEAPASVAVHPGQTQVRLGSVRVGAAEISRPLCGLAAAGEPARLGAGFLRRFRVQLDWESKLIRFEPRDPARAVVEPALVGYGVGLWKYNGAYWMVYVAQGSPAAKAGLVSGGILTAVGGKDVKGMNVEALTALLEAHADARIELSVIQGDDMLVVELVPETLL